LRRIAPSGWASSCASAVASCPSAVTRPARASSERRVNGELEIETDEGEKVPKDGQKALLKDWHLELSAGQYRERTGRAARGVKLVHNIVLSMPSPTPPDKVLAAAKTFAREKFALNHRYAMALEIMDR